MIVMDSMVLIHLAKVSLLEKSCEYFKKVLIPEEVQKEVLKGKEKGYEDYKLVQELIRSKKLVVEKVKDKRLLHRAYEFNVKRGEGEALALTWQENADFLATDDDTVRKRAHLLNVRLIGTPAVMLALYRKGYMDRDKLRQSLNELRKIGWFSNSVIDKILLEAK